MRARLRYTYVFLRYLMLITATLVCVLFAGSDVLAETLTVSDPGQPSGTNVEAATAGALVGRLTLSVDTGSVVVTSVGVANTGTAVADDDLFKLHLYEDLNTNGVIDHGIDSLLGHSHWYAPASRHLFTGLDLEVASGSPRDLLLGMSLSQGAEPGRTFSMEVRDSDLVVQAPASVEPVTVSGDTFSVTALPVSGSMNPDAPTVMILNPRSRSVVSGVFRLQVKVYDPVDLNNVLSLDVSTDGGASYAEPFDLINDRNTNYSVGSNAAIYEKDLTLAPGAYTLKVSAENGTATSTSLPAVISVNATGEGDGMLLRRDNSSQLCNDCHALPDHSSQSAGGKYGSWGVGCRDCHKPHNTTNIFLMDEKIVVPNFSGIMGSGTKVVRLSKPKGHDTSGEATEKSYVNSDGTGICEVCHTRTEGAGGVARWRNTGNEDTHYAGSATARCTSCHPHSQGFKAAPDETSPDCYACHGGEDDDNNYFWNDGTTAKIDRNEWFSSGHGATTRYASLNPGAGFSEETDGGCLYCHDDSIAHDAAGIDFFRLKDQGTGPAGRWGPYNGTCLICHDEGGTSGYQPAGYTSGRDATVEVDETSHAGDVHNVSGHDGGQLCWDCHDPHGDDRGTTPPPERLWFMIQRNPVIDRDDSTMKPIELAPDVGFENADDYTDYISGGLCVSCHTATGHYPGSVTDDHPNDDYGSTERCTSCHLHDYGVSSTVMSCNDCHLSPSGGGNDNDNYDSNDGVTTMIDMDEWMYSGHGRVTAYDSGNAAAGFSSEPEGGCLYCHDEQSYHNGSGAGLFRLKDQGTGPGGSWGPHNGTCLICHVTGGVTGYQPAGYSSPRDATVEVGPVRHAGDKHNVSGHDGGESCWDCHDPHGDDDGSNPGTGPRLWFMMQKNPVRDRDDTTTYPLITAADVSFKEADDYTDYVAGGLCVNCHTSTDHYPGSVTDDHPNDDLGSIDPCVYCHGHNNGFDEAAPLGDTLTVSNPATGASGSVGTYVDIPMLSFQLDCDSSGDSACELGSVKVTELNGPDAGHWSSLKIFIDTDPDITGAALIGKHVNWDGTLQDIALTRGTRDDRIVINGTSKYLFVVYNLSEGSTLQARVTEVGVIAPDAGATGFSYDSAVITAPSDALSVSNNTPIQSTSPQSGDSVVMQRFMVDTDVAGNGQLELASVTIANLGTADENHIGSVDVYIDIDTDFSGATRMGSCTINAGTCYVDVASSVPQCDCEGVYYGEQRYLYVTYTTLPEISSGYTLKSRVTAVGVTPPDIGVTGLSLESNELTVDDCPADPAKIEPGICGCGTPDTDGDGDGYYVCEDCDDTNDAINPDTIWYLDADGDGYGNQAVSQQQCQQPAGPPDYVLNNADVDDGNPDIYPGGPPYCYNANSATYDSTIQGAYNDAADGSTIKVHDGTFTEELTLDINKTVTMQGGYDENFSTVTGITSVVGDVTISDGAATIEDFSIDQ